MPQNTPKQTRKARSGAGFYAAAAHAGLTTTGVLSGTGKTATADAAFDLRPLSVAEEAARVLSAGICLGSDDAHVAGLAAAIQRFLNALEPA